MVPPIDDHHIWESWPAPQLEKTVELAVMAGEWGSQLSGHEHGRADPTPSQPWGGLGKRWLPCPGPSLPWAGGRGSPEVMRTGELGTVGPALHLSSTALLTKVAGRGMGEPALWV